MASSRALGRKVRTYSQPTTGGKSFRCSLRTAAHLDWTKKRLAKKARRDKKHYELLIIQGCYNVGVAASAGTHNKDAVLDVEIVGMSWLEAQAFLRSCGWAAWYRKPPLFDPHIHMVSLGYVDPVGSLVPGQVYDYYHHLDGLADHGPDNTWHPRKQYVFRYGRWVVVQRMNRWLEALRRRARILPRAAKRRTAWLAGLIKTALRRRRNHAQKR